MPHLALGEDEYGLDVLLPELVQMKKLHHAPPQLLELSTTTLLLIWIPLSINHSHHLGLQHRTAWLDQKEEFTSAEFASAVCTGRQ